VLASLTSQVGMSLIIVAVAGWLALRTPRLTSNPDTEVLDLRNVSPLSGEQGIESGQILVLHRSTRHVVLKQARGTEDVAIQEIAVFTDTGANVFDTTVRPRFEEQILLIRIDVDLRRLDAGSYRLGVRRPGLTWTEYRLHIP
jgi:hypothetical protein